MRTVDTKEYLDTVCGMLAEGNTGVPVPVAGTSMCPFLHPGDMVYLDTVTSAPRKGEILLFVRRNGQYVLHRVARRNRDGSLLMLGDNQTVLEPVAGAQIRARASYVRRGGKTVAPGSMIWWFFAGPWLWLAPIRGTVGKIWRRVKTLLPS